MRARVDMHFQVILESNAKRKGKTCGGMKHRMKLRREDLNINIKKNLPSTLTQSNKNAVACQFVYYFLFFRFLN